MTQLIEAAKAALELLESTYRLSESPEVNRVIAALRAALPALREVPADALADMEARKDAAYLERNRCVALIARMALALGCRAGVARTAIEGWSDDWHGCVYIELPTGQASWHFHDSQAHLFDGLPPYAGAWDGHDTPTKYERVAGAYAAPPAPAQPAQGGGVADLRCAFWLDPECADAGACQSLKFKAANATPTPAPAQPAQGGPLDDFGRPIVYDTEAVDNVTHALTGDEGEDDSVTVLERFAAYVGNVWPEKPALQVLMEYEEQQIASAPAAPDEPGAGVVEALIEPWKTARFGVFLPDGRFEELPPDDPVGMKHPQGHTARWCGGLHDVQLLRAALATQTGRPK